ncbi:hypothetical protein D3C84_305810 [compost metagenome]
MAASMRVRRSMSAVPELCWINYGPRPDIYQSQSQRLGDFTLSRAVIQSSTTSYCSWEYMDST